MTTIAYCDVNEYYITKQYKNRFCASYSHIMTNIKIQSYTTLWEKQAHSLDSYTKLYYDAPNTIILAKLYNGTWAHDLIHHDEGSTV